MDNDMKVMELTRAYKFRITKSFPPTSSGCNSLVLQQTKVFTSRFL
ncbi:hypothetical protein M1590_04360 [Candidatus Marsarchaeota archaeon]|nr:hypothetical protein [Candidatus Marsarchaeota archaeon]